MHLVPNFEPVVKSIDGNRIVLQLQPFQLARPRLAHVQVPHLRKVAHGLTYSEPFPNVPDTYIYRVKSWEDLDLLVSDVERVSVPSIVKKTKVRRWFFFTKEKITTTILPDTYRVTVTSRTGKDLPEYIQAITFLNPATGLTTTYWDLHKCGDKYVAADWHTERLSPVDYHAKFRA